MGYVEFLEPIDQGARDRILGGEPFDLLTPSVTVVQVLEADRDGRQSFLVVEAEKA